jgi:hypothetical protein
MKVVPRYKITDAEHERMVEVGNLFWDALGRLAATHIALMPAELHDWAAEYLQERCSVYGTEYDKHLEKLNG